MVASLLIVRSQHNLAVSAPVLRHDLEGRVLSEAYGSAPVRAGRHLVYFYADDDDLAKTVGRHIVETLGNDGVAVAAATGAHLRAFDAELRRAGIDLEVARAVGSYSTFDSEQLLRRVTIDGELDRDGLDAVLGEIIGATAGSAARPFLYGEIAPPLWDAGMTDAALDIEARAHEMITDIDITVLCGYRRTRSLSDPHKHDAIRNLCHHHTHLTSLPFPI
jgi:hypothetical protein